MPNLLMQRIVKNIGLSFACLCLAIVVGFSMQSFSMFAVPAAIFLVLCAGTVRLIVRHRKGVFYVWSGKCIGSSKSFLPSRLDYIFQNSEGESVVVKARGAKEFRETLCYELLFEYSGDPDVPDNLMDSTVCS